MKERDDGVVLTTILIVGVWAFVAGWIANGLIA